MKQPYDQKIVKEVMLQAATAMSSTILSSYLNAMVLRAEVHVNLAYRNGAEPEDLGAIIGNAFATGNQALLNTLNEISELNKANEIAKEK